jgi:hypothetical protein
MRDEFKPAIDALVADLREQERRMATTKQMINRLCELADAPPMFADVSLSDRPAVTGIRSDHFYGKVQTTAAREYLELRYAAHQGPAPPREIFDALVAGGFKFDTKNELNAITGLRATLRKNSSIFHKLPNGDYGLLSWYPNAKAPIRPDDEEVEPARKGRPRGRPKSNAGARAPRTSPKGKTAKPSKAKSDNPLRPVVLAILNDGGELGVDQIRAETIKRRAPDAQQPTPKDIHTTLLGLKSSRLAVLVRKGTWRVTSTRTDRDEEPTEGVVHLRTSVA